MLVTGGQHSLRSTLVSWCPVSTLAWLQVLRVRSCVAGSHAQQVLRDGDLVLAVAAQPVTSFTAVERIIASYCSGEDVVGIQENGTGGKLCEDAD